MKEKNIRDEFLDDVIQCVKFQWDRHKIREELANHIEDRRDYYTSKGMTEDEAELNAVSTMGDAKEIGEALNKVHKPWIGRLWIATTVTLCFLLFSILFSPSTIVSNIREVLTPVEVQIEKMIEKYNARSDEFYREEIAKEVTVVNVKIEFTDAIFYNSDNIGGEYAIVYLYGYLDNRDLLHPLNSHGLSCEDYGLWPNTFVRVDEENNEAIFYIRDDEEMHKINTQVKGKIIDGVAGSYVLSNQNNRIGFQLGGKVLSNIKSVRVSYDRYGEQFEFSVPLKVNMSGGDDNA